MAERSFYDILEVSETASSETIQAAYDRLAAKFDPAKAGNADSAANRIQFNAIRQAYLVLSNTDNRAQYDRKQQMKNSPAAQPVQVMEPFWTLPKMLIAGLIVVATAGFYFKHQKEQMRMETEKAIAVAKAREAEEKARSEAEVQRLTMQQETERERTERMESARLRRERDADINRVQRENRVNEITNRVYSSVDRAQAQNEDYRRRAEESRIKREELQANAAARQQLARDRAELCRIERERYGRALSC